MSGKVTVLVVDDSAFMRKVVSDLLSEDPDLTVVGTARDGLEAIAKTAQFAPQVVTLDVEMPRMDGLTALKELLRRFRVAVVMVSSLTQDGARTTIEALALGAVDFVAKPSGSLSLDMAKVKEELRHKVKTAARARVACYPAAQPLRRPGGPKPAGGVSRQLVVIGCSTGGPNALHHVLPALPGDLPAGVVVVQHMPAGFTRSLAERLNALSRLRVREAAEGDATEQGTALIAPGGWHLLVGPEGRLSLNQDPPLHGVRPAVDHTLVSAAEVFGRNCVAVIMTGMGYDGARGVTELKRRGGRVIAEHESSCVVYGMPRVVVEMGNADRVVPVDQIAPAVVEMLKA